MNVVGLAVDPEGTAQRLALPGATPPPAPEPEEPASTAGRAPAQHKSPYRLDGDTLYLLDQRGLPDRLDEQVCRRGSDVAFYMRVMAVRGGPLMGQLAAYGLAMTAKEFAPRTWHARQAEWKRVCRALVAARTGSRMLRFAIDRMTAVHDTFGPDVDSLAIADGAAAAGGQPGHGVPARPRHDRADARRAAAPTGGPAAAPCSSTARPAPAPAATSARG